MKKLSVFLFVCLLTFFFTACGQEEVSSPESSSLPEASTPPLISSEPVSEPTSEPISELVPNLKAPFLLKKTSALLFFLVRNTPLPTTLSPAS